MTSSGGLEANLSTGLAGPGCSTPRRKVVFPCDVVDLDTALAYAAHMAAIERAAGEQRARDIEFAELAGVLHEQVAVHPQPPRPYSRPCKSCLDLAHRLLAEHRPPHRPSEAPVGPCEPLATQLALWAADSRQVPS